MTKRARKDLQSSVASEEERWWIEVVHKLEWMS